MLFEAYMQDGMCIRGEDWNQVDPNDVKALICHHPWVPGVSVVVEAETESCEYFLWKEALATVGNAPNLVKVVFGKKEAGETLKISFIVGGGIEAERY